MNLLRYFCRNHEHEYEGDKPYVAPDDNTIYCHFPDVNFTISTIRHFGMHQSNWFGAKNHRSTDAITFEDRLDKHVLPMAEKFGRPDLMVFTSGLWG